MSGTHDNARLRSNFEPGFAVLTPDGDLMLADDGDPCCCWYQVFICDFLRTPYTTSNGGVTNTYWVHRSNMPVIGSPHTFTMITGSPCLITAAENGGDTARNVVLPEDGIEVMPGMVSLLCMCCAAMPHLRVTLDGLVKCCQPHILGGIHDETIDFDMNGVYLLNSVDGCHYRYQFPILHFLIWDTDGCTGGSTTNPVFFFAPWIDVFVSNTTKKLATFNVGFAGAFGTTSLVANFLGAVDFATWYANQYTGCDPPDKSADGSYYGGRGMVELVGP